MNRTGYRAACTVSAVLALVLTVVPTQIASAVAPVLDPTFSDDGLVTNGYPEAGLAVQADGEVLGQTPPTFEVIPQAIRMKL